MEEGDVANVPGGVIKIYAVGKKLCKGVPILTVENKETLDTQGQREPASLQVRVEELEKGSQEVAGIWRNALAFEGLQNVWPVGSR